MSSRGYELRVSGRLSDRTRGAFTDLVVVNAPPETILYGDIPDEAQLHGVLATVQDLGPRVVSLHEVSPAPSGWPSRRAATCSRT